MKKTWEEEKISLQHCGQLQTRQGLPGGRKEGQALETSGAFTKCQFLCWALFIQPTEIAIITISLYRFF